MSDLVSASGKPVKIPGPDHPITLTRHPMRVVVQAAGQILADSRNALILREANYPPVFYFPREDVKMVLLQKNHRVSYCPYKGDCSYFDLALNGPQGNNTAWSYEMPYNAVVAIKDHLAFYADKVAEIRTEACAAVAAERGLVDIPLIPTHYVYYRKLIRFPYVLIRHKRNSEQVPRCLPLRDLPLPSIS